VDGDVTAALRAFDPPVIARVVDDRTVLDLRTVDPSDDAVVAAALASVG
jgi:L-seryl-tRNA(Ser) seleniumtransferase